MFLRQRAHLRKNRGTKIGQFAFGISGLFLIIFIPASDVVVDTLSQGVSIWQSRRLDV